MIRTKQGTWALAALTALAIGGGGLASPQTGFAAERSVTVALPDFTVRLNGHQVDNRNREYPLFVYKDITYVPMTWYDSRLLGLETKWSDSSGLAIEKGSVASSYAAYSTNNRNVRSFKASVPDFGITVHGKAVDNGSETYPLLSYRDVVYFPLTWKFAHDEFGWDYVWDDEQGLAITSDNPQIETLDLPANTGDNGFALFEGYYYFAETERNADGGDTSNIYRTPVGDTSRKQLVYTVHLGDDHHISPNVGFSIADNAVWFSYHVGGAIMGYDVFGKIDDDGKATIVHQGYLDFKSAPNGTLLISHSVPPGSNNLSLVPAGQEDKDGKSVGDPNLIYGWHIVMNDGGSSYGRDSSTAVVGDDAYVLASPYPAQSADLNKIYKVNLTTNETKRIVNASVSHFRVIGSKLYYVKDADQYLYSSELDGSNERQVSRNPAAAAYGEIGGSIYYTSPAADPNTFKLYKANPSDSGEDTLVLQEPLESVRFEADHILCKLPAGADYGLKILDPSGALRLAVADQAAGIADDGNTIVFVSAQDKSVKRIQ